MRIVISMVVILSLIPATAAAAWTKRSGPEQAGVHRILVGAPGEILALGMRGQLYVTEDWGATWTVRSGPEELTRSFAYGHDTFYRLTDSGLLLSQDAGSTWSAHPAGLPAGASPSQVEITADAGALYLRDGTTVFAVDDGAASWRSTSIAGISSSWAAAIYATDDALFVALGGGGLAVSRDGAASFNVVIGPGELQSGEFIDGFIRAHPDGDRIVAFGSRGLWISSDAGSTWDRMAIETTAVATAGFLTDGRLIALKYNPVGWLILSSADTGPMISEDDVTLSPAAIAWDDLDLSVSAVPIHDLVAAYGRNIAAGSAYGIAIGTDMNLTAVDLGTDQSDLWFSSRGAEVGTRVIATGDRQGGAAWVADDVSGPWSRLFARSVHHLVALYDDGGALWGVEFRRGGAGELVREIVRLEPDGSASARSSGPAGWSEQHRIYGPRTFMPAAGTLWAIGDDGLSVSADGGQTWALRLADATAVVGTAMGLAAISDGSIWFSSDGTSWSDSGKGGSLYSTQRALYTASSSELWSSLDGGASWREVGSLAGTDTGRTNRFEETADGSLLFLCNAPLVTGARSVFASTDGGRTWTALDEGWPDASTDRQVECIDILVDGSTVVATTDGYGMFRTTVSEVRVAIDGESEPPPTPAPSSGGGSVWAILLLLISGRSARSRRDVAPTSVRPR
jgi:photosystem II stability/assembly factor-like uncharacterized protein